MGPRSSERGMTTAYGAAQLYFTLQWGRARLSAEWKKFQNVVGIIYIASMGPRSSERGKC